MMRDPVAKASDPLELVADPDASRLDRRCPWKCSVKSLFPQQDLIRMGTKLLWTLRGRR